MYELQQVLWVVGLGLAAALAVKMAIQHLFRTYTWFFVFLCFEILRSLILLPVPTNSSKYAWAFLATQPIMWVFYILVVLELYTVAFSGYRGITSLTRWVVTGSLGLAVAISSLTLWADLAGPAGKYRILIYYSVVERGLVFSLVVFLVLITLFLYWFPISIRRNLILHAGVFSIYFLASTFTLFVRNIAGYHTTPSVNAVLVFVDVVCFGIWLYRFDRSGEAETSVVRSRWQAEDADRLLQQMDALNSTLLKRTGR